PNESKRVSAPLAAGDENWDGQFTLGDLGQSVSALAWDGTSLYAGGHFLTAGGSVVNYMAKGNGSAWSALGSGVNSWVNALVWEGQTFMPAATLRRLEV